MLNFTILEVLAQERPDNPSSPLLNKGILFFGLSGGGSLRESENEDLLIVKIQEQKKSGFNVLLSGGYMIKNDLALGGAIRYDVSRLSKITEDTDDIVSEVREAGSILTSSVYLKYFIPLTPSKRINLYNIAGIAWVADRLTNETFSQSILTRTYISKNTVQLGFSPGIQVFIINGFATELGVNVAGLSGSRKMVTINGTPESSVNTFDVDLKINLLSVNISFYYYFPI
jgi:hypothetical protein